MGQTVVNVLHCRISIYPRNLTSNHMSLFLTYMKALHHQPLIIFNTGFINLISVSSACQSWYLPLLSFWFEGSPTSPHREEQRTGLSDQQKDRVRIINHRHTLQERSSLGTRQSHCMALNSSTSNNSLFAHSHCRSQTAKENKGNFWMGYCWTC